jgi:hypothetical protein
MSTSTQAATLPPLNPKAVIAAIGTLAVALIAILTVFKVVDWSAAQTALVTAETAAVIGFVTAIVAHLTPGTSKEPVALAATFTATVSATLALGTGFGWWSLSEQQVSALVGLLTAMIGVGTALFARQYVTAGVTSTTKSYGSPSDPPLTQGSLPQGVGGGRLGNDVRVPAPPAADPSRSDRFPILPARSSPSQWRRCVGSLATRFRGTSWRTDDRFGGSGFGCDGHRFAYASDRRLQ